jgi:hypothetical protein
MGRNLKNNEHENKNMCGGARDERMRNDGVRSKGRSLH